MKEKAPNETATVRFILFRGEGKYYDFHSFPKHQLNRTYNLVGGPSKCERKYCTFCAFDKN